MLPKLFSVKNASIHTSSAEIKVMTGFDALAWVPCATFKSTAMPLDGAVIVLQAKFNLASSSLDKAAFTAGLSSPLFPSFSLLLVRDAWLASKLCLA